MVDSENMPPESEMDAVALPPKQHRRPRSPRENDVYVPPAKRRLLEAPAVAADDATAADDSPAAQRASWDAERRIVHGTVNRLNAETIKPLIFELFSKVNLVRLRGVLAKSLLTAAASSVRFAGVYAALVAVINSKLPQVGELVVARAILAFRRHYRRREKAPTVAMAVLLGQLFHQAVLHELVVLQILTLLLDGDPTDDSVEVAVELLTVTGYQLLQVTPAGVRAVLERFRALLHEGQLSKRVEHKMEQLLKLRKDGFQAGAPPVPEELDLVESEDQITLELSLDDETLQREDYLDTFHVDPDYLEHEREWKMIRAEILGLSGSDEESESGESETDDDGSEDGGRREELEEVQETALVPTSGTGEVIVKDLSEADLVHLRRSIYLTIMSSATFEECSHKLAGIDIPRGREEELINMIIECCSQERTFLRYYGMIASRFCLLDPRWHDAFCEAFGRQYSTIHRLETNKLRNVAKLFAHLLHTDSIPWSVLNVIHLNEDETTSSSRIFVKIVMQEVAEAIGVKKLNERFETEDPAKQEWYKGMFPRDNLRNTRYAINFFTSIGLGAITESLREYLKNAPKLIMQQAEQKALAKKDDDSSSVSSSSSSSDSNTSSSSTSSSSRSSRSSRSGSSASRSYSSSSSSSYSRRRRSRGRSRRRRRSDSESTSSSSSSSYSSASGSSASRSRSPPRSRARRGRSSPRSRSPERAPEERRSPKEPPRDRREQD